METVIETLRAIYRNTKPIFYHRKGVMRMMKIGDRVVYVDPTRRERNALVTAVWTAVPHPSLNLVIVADDEAKADTYGRQIEHVTSIVHESMQGAGANCWK